MSMKKAVRNKLMKKYVEKCNILSISDKDFYYLANINLKNNNMSYCRYVLDKRLRNNLLKSRYIELIDRPKNNSNLYAKYGEYIIRHVLNINHMIYGSNCQLGLMEDIDEYFNKEFVWTFVVPYESYFIYIKIKFIKNTVKIISFHENEPKYQYIFIN